MGNKRKKSNKQKPRPQTKQIKREMPILPSEKVMDAPQKKPSLTERVKSFMGLLFVRRFRSPVVSDITAYNQHDEEKKPAMNRNHDGSISSVTNYYENYPMNPQGEADNTWKGIGGEVPQEFQGETLTETTFLTSIDVSSSQDEKLSEGEVESFLPATSSLTALEKEDTQSTQEAEPLSFEMVGDDTPLPHLSLEASSGSIFTFRVFRMEGSGSHDYQDATSANADTGFAAISDGTTLGGYSKIVANGLVNRFVGGGVDLDDTEQRETWWMETRKEWYAALRNRYNDASSSEQSRWDKGGSATFMGIRVLEDGTYRLYYVGDCSLFWFDNGLKTLKGIQGAETFNSHPDVFHTGEASSPDELLTSNAEVRRLKGSVALLTTDALAKSFQENQPWINVPDFGRRLLEGSKEELRDWFQAEKTADRLDPDDYTFLLLQLPTYKPMDAEE